MIVRTAKSFYKALGRLASWSQNLHDQSCDHAQEL